MEPAQNPREWLLMLNQGLAVCALVAFAWTAWQVGKWFGVNILLPLRDALTSHLAAVNGSLESFAEFNSEIAANLRELREHSERMERRLDGLTERHRPSQGEPRA